MSVKPIRDHAEHTAAVDRINALYREVDAQAKRIEAYENIHYPIEKPTPEEARAFRHEQMGRRRIGPIQADDYLVTSNAFCPGCGFPFRPGEYVTLVPIGPGADPEARQKCAEGRPYNAIAKPAHWTCVTGEQ